MLNTKDPEGQSNPPATPTKSVPTTKDKNRMLGLGLTVVIVLVVLALVFAATR